MKRAMILALAGVLVSGFSFDASAVFFQPEDLWQENFVGGPPSSEPWGIYGGGTWSWDTPKKGIATMDSTGANAELFLPIGDASAPLQTIWTGTEPVVLEMRARVNLQTANNGAFIFQFNDGTGNDIRHDINLHDNGVYLDCWNDCVVPENFFAIDTSEFHDYMMVYDPTGGPGGNGFSELWVDSKPTGVTMDQAESAAGGNSRGDPGYLTLGDNCGGCYAGIVEITAARVGRTIPEPASLALLGLGGLCLLRRRRAAA